MVECSQACFFTLAELVDGEEVITTHIALTSEALPPWKSVTDAMRYPQAAFEMTCSDAIRVIELQVGTYFGITGALPLFFNFTSTLTIGHGHYHA